MYFAIVIASQTYKYLLKKTRGAYAELNLSKQFIYICTKCIDMKTVEVLGAKTRAELVEKTEAALNGGLDVFT